METTKSVKQTLTILLAYLWILCLFYNAIPFLDYTFFGSFLDALFNWSADFSWFTRLILALPMLCLIAMTTLYVQQRRGRHNIKNWQVTTAMLIAMVVHNAYHSVIIWGDDILTIFLTYYLNLEYDTFNRAMEWVLGEDFMTIHWLNIIMSIVFQFCLFLYRRLLKLEKAEQPTKRILKTMPPIPAIY